MKQSVSVIRKNKQGHMEDGPNMHQNGVVNGVGNDTRGSWGRAMLLVSFSIGLL